MHRRKLPAKIGDLLTPQQYVDLEELGILADKDDQVSVNPTKSLSVSLYAVCSPIRGHSSEPLARPQASESTFPSAIEQQPIAAACMNYAGHPGQVLGSQHRYCLVSLQGILLQIFSKPLSDRPTVFIEIIQRIGCEREVCLLHNAVFRPCFSLSNAWSGACAGLAQADARVLPSQGARLPPRNRHVQTLANDDLVQQTY